MSFGLPRDDHAEFEAAACAVASARGARIAAEHIGPGDFYVPLYRRLFSAALLLDDVGPFDAPVDSQHVRGMAAAMVADVETEKVTSMLSMRSFLIDTKAIFARRVAAAAAKRRAMEDLAEAFNMLGTGNDLADIAPLLGRVKVLVR